MSSNKKALDSIDKIFKIFVSSNCTIKPHFVLTGPSGSGKSFNIKLTAEMNNLNYLEINAAQLTKEGTSGNSLSKALSPLANTGGKPTICFVDEFDKLFISGNSNSQLSHETTNGVQNEFLKVLESDHTTVYGDYGKYIDVSSENVLFVFAGAFNGEENVTVDRLRDFGIKTEFIGRVGLVYNLNRLTLDDLKNILDKSVLLKNYLKLFPEVKKKEVVSAVMEVVTSNHEKNTLGARLLTSLLNKYFIEGGKLTEDSAKEVAFQRTLSL